jgi:hypothetical protein
VRLRCAFARGLAMAGHFDEARAELNRAYAFAPKGVEPNDLLTRAIYQLHRAEHHILEALGTRGKIAAWKTAQLRTAIDSLEQAELLLRTGRRKVFWWCRLYILKAKAHLELLKLDPSPRRALTTDRAVRRDALLVAGLTAIAGGLSNVFGNHQRRVFLTMLWRALRRESARIDMTGQDLPGISGAPHAQRSRWLLLNMRAGLEWFWKKQMGRFAVPTVTAALHHRARFVEVGLMDLGHGGMKLSDHAGLPPKLTRARIHLRKGSELHAQLEGDVARRVDARTRERSMGVVFREHKFRHTMSLDRLLPQDDGTRPTREEPYFPPVSAK